MREETFTPGPWPEPVRTAAGNWLLGRSPAIAGAPKEADARLIASAPELLEALEKLLASYKSLADSGDAGFWSLEDTDEGKQALAAIQKAKGLEPRLMGEEK